MDLGAIILAPFDVRHLAHLHEAVSGTCGSYKVLLDRARVAYGMHGELGDRIVVHLQAGDVHDPFLFMTEHEGFGASLSGCLGDTLGDVPTSTAWSVARDRRTGFCSVARGFHFTAEGVDAAEDSGPIDRLASKLTVAADVLVRLLEVPVTDWLPVTSALPPGAVAALTARLGVAPLPDHPPRAEAAGNFSFYLPEPLCRDAQEQAQRLKLTLGTLFAAVWEMAKGEVYGSTPVLGEDFELGPPMKAPAALPVADLLIPSSADLVPEVPASRDKVLVEIVASARMVEEVQVLARAADRAQSWVMQQAYVAARARLHQARRR
jgi:hypothetical protein